LNVFFACLAPSTQLVTDAAGKAMLVDELGLQVDRVSTELDCLSDAEFGLVGSRQARGLQPELPRASLFSATNLS
jgi:hypothetical protein